MEENSDVFCENYINIESLFPPWSTRDGEVAQFLINFTFSYEYEFTEWVESQDSPLPHLLSEYSYSEEDKSIVLNLHEFLDKSICRGIMAWELREWALTNAQCARLILTALKRASRVAPSMPSYHNVLNLGLRVLVTDRLTIRRGGDTSTMSGLMQESFNAAEQKVTGAARGRGGDGDEGEIEVGLNEMEMCTICLEEVGEGVQMPCSHVFHGDCIEEWLRIDHRCPLCRVEMPVAMETYES